MREDRRATRNRIYTLVAAGLMVVTSLVAMTSFLVTGREQIDKKLHRYPWKVLRELVRLQERFRRLDLDQDGVHDYATALSELEQAHLLPRVIAEEEVHGYRYAITRASADGWGAAATPARVDSSTLFYEIDHTGVVRAAKDGPPGPDAAIYWHPQYERMWPGPEGAEVPDRPPPAPE